MVKKLIKWLLLLTLIKGLVWLLLTPIFQVPDEPSHFSIIQFVSETGRRPHPRREGVTSQELMTASAILQFDWRINHPAWKGYQPNWQQKLAAIPTWESYNWVDNPEQKSLKRPPVYYYLATPFYLAVKAQSLVVRLFAVRLFSVAINLVTVWASYLLGLALFNGGFLAVAVASLVSLQPMLSYMSVGVHYDPLGILVTTVFVYLMVRFIKEKRSKWRRLSLIVSLFSVLVKPDLIVLPLLWVMATVKRKSFWLAGLLLLVALLSWFPAQFGKLIVAAPAKSLSDRFLYLINLNEYSYHARFLVTELFSGRIFGQFWSYLTATGSTHLAQVFPWYWGVFGWLEKTMPLWVYRLLKIVVLVSSFGLVRWFYQAWKQKQWSKVRVRQWLFLLLASGLHLLVIIYNDFKVFTTSGESFGIQGRYLLPMVSVHMLFLVLGLSQLVKTKKHHLLAGAVIGGSILLNLIGLQSLYQYFGWVW